MRFAFASSLFFSCVALPVLAATSDASSTSSRGDKIVVELYYEAQCPGCREVITKSFSDAFHKKDLLDMADVVFVPYGNARETNTESPYTYQCQHGPSECEYNTIEACLITMTLDDPITQFKVLECIEMRDNDRNPSPSTFQIVLEDCAKRARLESSVVGDIMECTTSPEGNELMHKLALKTAALEPAHTYVPWIVVDGVHSKDFEGEIGASLWRYVCANYDGPNKSPKCPPGDVTPNFRGAASVEGDARVGEVCYREEDRDHAFALVAK